MQPRRVQLVSTKPQREAVVQWMIAKIEDDGTDTRIADQKVEYFPNLFKQTNRRSNREKARQWWNTRKEFLSAIQTPRKNHCRLPRFI